MPPGEKDQSSLTDLAQLDPEEVCDKPNDGVSVKGKYWSCEGESQHRSRVA